MTTPKNNKGGAKEVTTTQNNKVVSNTTNSAAKATTTPKSEEKAAEPKPTPTPLVTAPKVVEMKKAPKTLEEQIQYFLGMEKLVTKVRRLEQHLEAVQELTVSDQDLEKFENQNESGAHLELYDTDNKRYRITNPRLVKEMLTHLENQIEGKIGEYNAKILEFDPTPKTAA